MKTQKIKPNLLPIFSAPVVCSNRLTSTALSSQCLASVQCDIITRQCTPFAGDDAE